MIKNTLSLLAFLFGASIVAQTGKIVSNPIKHQANISLLNYVSSARTATGQTCDSIVTIAQSANLVVGTAGTDTTTPGCSPKAGYVSGTNCYGDKEKANFYDGSLYGSISNVSITAVYALIFKTATEGTQGGGSSTVGMKLYGGTLSGGPGTAIGTGTTVPLSTAITASATGDFFFYLFKFAAPIQVPSTGFYASFVLPNQTPGDTAVVAEEDTPATNEAWEKFNDNSWHPYTDAVLSWGNNGKLMYIPKYCFNLSGAGISKNLGISERITVFPNPTNGIVKISTYFSKSENIEVNVTNALGIKVASITRNDAMMELISIDLSQLPSAVYFISVNNGSDKMVTRLVLNN